MGHLVQTLRISDQAPLDLQDCYQQLKAAHDYLVVQGMVALQQAHQLREPSNWGTQVKRIQVILPSEGRSALISDDQETHNLTEVYNQCAGIERLLDALAWALMALPDHQVVCCHPTTSSAKDENDLLLRSPCGDYARFEVSDVISPKDGNDKEAKELRNLGVLSSSDPTQWPAGRLFLVVSEEFAVKLRRKTNRHRSNISYYYVESKDSGSTRIFEVLPNIGH